MTPESLKRCMPTYQAKFSKDTRGGQNVWVTEVLWIRNLSAGTHPLGGYTFSSAI